VAKSLKEAQGLKMQGITEKRVSKTFSAKEVSI
jgi:hypothetical protein